MGLSSIHGNISKHFIWLKFYHYSEPITVPFLSAQNTLYALNNETNISSRYVIFA